MHGSGAVISCAPISPGAVRIRALPWFCSCSYKLYSTVCGAVLSCDPPGSRAVLSYDPPGSGAVLSCDLPGSGAVLCREPPGSGTVPRCAIPGSGAVIS